MNLVLILLLLSIIHKFTVTIMNFVVKIVVDVDLLEKDLMQLVKTNCMAIVLISTVH